MLVLMYRPVRDWTGIRTRLQGQLSEAEERLLDLLIAGRTQPEIGKLLRLHRSAVWRRIRKITTLADKV
jgi:DNA-binding CsgD family transcriptional regulator